MSLQDHIDALGGWRYPQLRQAIDRHASRAAELARCDAIDESMMELADIAAIVTELVDVELCLDVSELA